MAFIHLPSQPVLYCDSWELFVGKNNVLLTFLQACQICLGMGTVLWWCYCCSVRYKRDFRKQENRLNTMCCSSYSWSAVSRWQRRRRNFWKSTLLSICHKGWSQRMISAVVWVLFWHWSCKFGPECGWRIFCWPCLNFFLKKKFKHAPLSAWASLEKEYELQNECKDSVRPAV